MTPVTPAQEQRLRGLRQLARVLDSAFAIPGTKYRVGIDPILGLIPGVGDVVAGLFTAGIIVQAWQLGVPRVVLARMVINLAVDAVLGAVPLIGDLFDFAWKANERNLTLLERHVHERRVASAGDWAFVVLMLLLVTAVAATPFILLGVLISWLL